MSELLRKENGSVDANAYKGLRAMYDVNGMKVFVRITDTRQAYGRFDVCVEPASGVGYRWIDIRNIELLDEPKPSTTTTPTVMELVARAKAHYELSSE